MSAATPALPDIARQFIEAAVVAGDMALPFHYPHLGDWAGLQIGFRAHGITGASLVGAAPGQWQVGWYVLARNGFDDPFFIDLNEAAQGYPVYCAPIGAGRWDAQQVAPNLLRMGKMLAALRDLGNDHPAVLRWLQAEADLGMALWREVLEERQSALQTQADEPAEPDMPAPPTDPADWQSGRLVITASGPLKMKVVQLLRQVQKLSPQQALALVARPEITAAEGNRVQLQRLQARLQALGASVAFRSD